MSSIWCRLTLCACKTLQVDGVAAVDLFDVSTVSILPTSPTEIQGEQLMAAIEFYSNGKLHRLAARLPGKLAAPKTRGASVMGMKLVAESGPVIIRAIHGQSSRLEFVVPRRL